MKKKTIYFLFIFLVIIFSNMNEIVEIELVSSRKISKYYYFYYDKEAKNFIFYDRIY